MKRFLLQSLLLAVIFSFSISAIEDEGNCDIRVLKNNLIQLLKPDFKYDSSNTSRFIVEQETQGTEITVPLFSTEKYRLLFNTSALPVNVTIKIYDKKVGSRNRKLLHTITDSKSSDERLYSYEPDAPRPMYIDYLVSGSEEDLTGCIVFLLGYKVG